jgi:glutamate carboxypeptidase
MKAPISADRAAALRGRAGLLRAAALERWEQLVRLESPSGDARRMADLNLELERGYRATGARTVPVAGAHGDHLVCHWSGDPGACGHVLLVAHSDTVFPAGTTADRPFRLAADGDTVTGPGVFDMKGALTQVELAMRMLADQDVSPRRPVRLVVVADEEVGSPDGQRVVAEQARGAQAVLGLEPPLPGGGLKVGRRGVARIRLRVDGVTAHAGLDAHLGVSAVDELVDQLVALRGRLPQAPEASANVGTLSGGTRANVVAGEAEAELGLRFRTAEAERAVFAALASLEPVRKGARLHTERLSYRPAWSPDLSSPLAAELVALAGGMGFSLPLGTSGGAGDTNATGAAGIPTVDGLGPEGSGAHGDAEQASLASLLDRSALLAAFLS